jgi:pyruvate,orthophosphate dikinase
VTIRLLDPPLHEFLPNAEELMSELGELKMACAWRPRWRHGQPARRDRREAPAAASRSIAFAKLTRCSASAAAVWAWCFPKSRACSAARSSKPPARCRARKKKDELEIMVPLVSLSEELHQQRELIDEVARQVMGEHGMTIEYLSAR